jgi:hypothetical protein
MAHGYYRGTARPILPPRYNPSLLQKFWNIQLLYTIILFYYHNMSSVKLFCLNSRVQKSLVKHLLTENVKTPVNLFTNFKMMILKRAWNCLDQDKLFFKILILLSNMKWEIHEIFVYYVLQVHSVQYLGRKLFNNRCFDIFAHSQILNLNKPNCLGHLCWLGYSICLCVWVCVVCCVA